MVIALQSLKAGPFTPYYFIPYLTAYSSSGPLDPPGPLEARPGEVPLLQTGQASALHSESWRDALPALSLVPPRTPVSRMHCGYATPDSLKILYDFNPSLRTLSHIC